MKTAKDLLLKNAESADIYAKRLETMAAEARAQAETDERAALAQRSAANEYRAAAEALSK